MLWVIGSVVIVALIGLYAVATYNGLVGKRNQVKNAWSQIDVQLVRRHDLIPNLVNAVQGMMEHEKSVLESVTRARQDAIAAGDNVAQRSLAEAELTRATHALFARAEAYPTLRTNENVQALQEELATTENKIAFARQFYNDAVQRYNTAREVFPASLVAGGFAPAELFAADDATSRAVPEVKLA
ncbi:MAG TPA: LemA family protein [Thermomicrobiaceae bacterium]|nr:LemA family protein [Thermomicrobiaceae bacterium]